MKNLYKVLGIIALAAVIGFTFAACGGDDGGSNPGGGTNPGDGSDGDTSVIYRSADDNNSYELEITKSGARAAYKPKDGDDYTMTVTKRSDGSSKKSDGKVKTASDGRFTLEKDGKSFEVTVADGAMTDIKGDIPLNDGTTIPSPGEVTKVGAFTITGIPAKYEGLYAAFDGYEFGVHGAIAFLDEEPYEILPVISDGKVVIPAWTRDWNGDGQAKRYSGNDTFKDFVVVLSRNPRDAYAYEFIAFGTEAKPLKFSDGSAERKWSDGEIRGDQVP
jgi:hypothetical protein